MIRETFFFLIKGIHAHGEKKKIKQYRGCKVRNRFLFTSPLFLTPSPIWRRKWQPTPVFLSGKSYGQRSLVGRKESDTAKRVCTHTHTHKYIYQDAKYVVVNVM